MNFVVIFFSSVLLLGGLSLFLNDDVIIIPLQSQIGTYQLDSHNDNLVDRYETGLTSSTVILRPLDSADNGAGGTKQVKALEHFVLANKARQNNDTENATLHLMKALLIDPEYGDARLRLVENLLKQGQRGLAKETLDQALTNYSTAPVFVAMRVRMLVQDGHLEDASMMLDNALSQFKGDEEILVLAASIDDQLGEFEKAAKLYQQLTEIDPLKLSYQVGQAMAVDHAGDANAATMLYQSIAEKLADSGTRLPFVDQRLAMLTSKTDQNTIQ